MLGCAILDLPPMEFKDLEFDRAWEELTKGPVSAEQCKYGSMRRYEPRANVNWDRWQYDKFQFEAKQRLKAVLHTWPHCNMKDAPVDIRWDMNGKAYWYCDRCG